MTVRVCCLSAVHKDMTVSLPDAPKDNAPQKYPPMSDELITSTRVGGTEDNRVLNATFADGDERLLFDFPDGEHRLFPAELHGLTEREATMLRYRRGLV